MIILKNKTNINLNRLSQNITRKLNQHNNPKHTKTRSYRPSINNKLVSLKSLKRTTLNHCNTVKAFKLLEPLQIAISKNKCARYDTPSAIKVLLDRPHKTHVLVLWDRSQAQDTYTYT